MNQWTITHMVHRAALLAYLLAWIFITTPLIFLFEGLGGVYSQWVDNLHHWIPKFKEGRYY